SCPRLLRKDCSAWLTDVEERLPTVVFAARDAAGRDLTEVRVSLDGVLVAGDLNGRALAVDPGPHTARFEAAERALEERFVAREREKGRLLAVVLGAAERPREPPAPEPPRQPSPQPAPRRKVPAASWVLGGVSVLGAAGFTYFWLSAVSRAKGLRDSCAPR